MNAQIYHDISVSVYELLNATSYGDYNWSHWMWQNTLCHGPAPIRRIQNYFDVVIILCPILLHNTTYMSRYDKIFGAKKANNKSTHFYWWHFPNHDSKKDHLGEAIDFFSKMFLGCQLLFVIDDMAADSGIAKKRGALNKLALSGRHTKRPLWVLTQKYNSIGKDVREQSMWLCSFYCEDANSFRVMLGEKDVKISKEEKDEVKQFLVDSKR